MEHFSAEQVQVLGIGQLSGEQLAAGRDALNGFATVFGRLWVESIFGPVRSNRVVLFVSRAWEAWCLIRPLPGSASLRKRWRHGFSEQGVLPEVLIVGELLKHGYPIELSPRVGQRKADFRVYVDGVWVFGEVARRSRSMAYLATSDALGRVSQAAADACPGLHGYVALLKTPDPEEVVRILDFLEAWAGGPDADLPGLAAFRSRPLTDEPSSTPVADLVQRPHMFSASVKVQGGVAVARGTALAAVKDAGARRLLEHESEQLPGDAPSVLVVDATQVVGGYRQWEEAAAPHLGSGNALKFSHLLVVSTALTASGLGIEGKLLRNPSAALQVPELAVAAISALFESSTAG